MIGRDYAIQKIQEAWEVFSNLVQVDKILNENKMLLLLMCLEKTSVEFSLPSLETLQEKSDIATQDFLDTLQSALFPNGFSIIAVATLIFFVKNWRNQENTIPIINDIVILDIIESVNDYFNSTERLPILTVESTGIFNGYDS